MWAMIGYDNDNGIDLFYKTRYEPNQSIYGFFTSRVNFLSLILLLLAFVDKKKLK